MCNFGVRSRFLDVIYGVRPPNGSPVPQLSNLCYEEQLKKLSLLSLYRRNRMDMIQVFKIVHNIDDISMNGLFEFSDTQTRGNTKK